MSQLGDTVTLTVGASDKVLTKINGPNNYASEYLLKEADRQFRVRVRHTQTKGGKNGAPAYDRHNFEVVETVYATESVPEHYRKAYFVFELLPTDVVVTLPDAMADLIIANANELLDELTDWKS
nr:MAG: coat protein [Leviviridae sp.]